MPKYLSGRAKRVPQDQLSEDRYQYLGLEQAEPNLSDPLVSPSVPSGAQYQLVAVPAYPGKRYWVPVGGGLVPGAITIFDEDSPVSSSSSITQLNFVGAAVTANVSVQSPSGHPGIAATVTVIPVSVGETPPNYPTPNEGELWWESDTGDLYIYYDDGDSAQWVMTNAGGRGLTGDKGQKGEVGQTGLTGNVGAKGDKGEKGQKGDVEAQGNKGQKGEIGAGQKGQKGDAGTDGTDGDKGQKGEDNSTKGQKGELGIGQKGEKGQKGLSGGGSSVTISDNAPGSANAGDLWWDSEDFDLHVYYGDGDSNQWVSITSNAALKGQKGEKGEKGEKGQKGDKGEKGQKGELGVSGNPGSKGEKGEKGQKGDAGTDGTDGDKGQKGEGDKGDKGQKGQDGNDGTGIKGNKGEEGNFGGVSFDYTYRTVTTDSDPGGGNLRLNNTNFSSATFLYIDDVDNDASNIESYIRTIDDSTSTLKGHFRISNKANYEDYAIFTINGTSTEATGYHKIPCSYLSGDTSLPNDTRVIITFARTGDIGQKGQKGEPSTVKGQKGEAGADGNDGSDGTSVKGQKGEAGADNSTKGDKGQKGDSGMDSSSQSSSYTLTASDEQELLLHSNNITIPPNVFSAGDAVTLHNTSSLERLVSRGSGVTLYMAGILYNQDRYIAARGLATIVCVASNTFVISGGGVR